MNHTPTIVDICVCTFRRVHITETLQSLARLTLPSDTNIRVIVADNDETPSARQRVESLTPSLPFPVLYLHAPARNISIARNACLDAATAPLVAFIDDDELATAAWITALIEQHRKTNAAATLGPVQSHYPDSAPAWLKQGDFHSIKPVWVNGAIITGYSSNILFTRAAAMGLRFDSALGRSGGEDTAFVSAIYRNGGLISYAEAAIVTENVAAQRLSLAWLLKRSYRSGQTHGRMLLVGTTNKSRVKQLALASAKALFCAAVAAGSVFTGRWRFWLLRAALHAGVVARLLGHQELTQYG